MITVLTLLALSGFRWNGAAGAAQPPSTPALVQKLISPQLAATIQAHNT